MIIIGIIALTLIVGNIRFSEIFGEQACCACRLYTRTLKLEALSKPNIWQLAAVKYLLMKNLHCKAFQNIRFIIRLNSKQQIKNTLSLLYATQRSTDKYLSIPEHFASWGFIVIGTEEEYDWSGF